MTGADDRADEVPGFVGHGERGASWVACRTFAAFAVSDGDTHCTSNGRSFAEARSATAFYRPIDDPQPDRVIRRHYLGCGLALLWGKLRWQSRRDGIGDRADFG